MNDREDCKSCDKLLDQVTRLSSENYTLRTEVERLKGMIDLVADEKFMAQDKARMLDLQNRDLQKRVETLVIQLDLTAEWLEAQESVAAQDIGKRVRIAARSEGSTTALKKCPSTYTHTTYGKLLCEKEEAHLNRRGDVEHTRDGVKWMSV